MEIVTAGETLTRLNANPAYAAVTNATKKSRSNEKKRIAVHILPDPAADAFFSSSFLDSTISIPVRFRFPRNCALTLRGPTSSFVPVDSANHF